jgi:hypothetical protein
VPVVGGTVVVMLVLLLAVPVDVGAEVAAAVVVLLDDVLVVDVDVVVSSSQPRRSPPRERAVFPMLPVAVTVRSYLVARRSDGPGEESPEISIAISVRREFWTKGANTDLCAS